MRILFAAIGAYGHLYPLLPLALACRDAGHDVTVATGLPFLDRLPLPTVPVYPPALKLSAVVATTRERHPELSGVDFAMAMFGDVTAGVSIPTLLEGAERDRPDLVVFEGLMSGAGVVADVLGIPAATFAIGLARAVYGGLHAATIGYHRDAWTERQRPVPPPGVLADVLLDPSPPSLHRSDGPVDVPVVPVRTVAYSASDAALPAWLSGERTRPRVYLTLGTVSFGAVEVLRRAVTEIAALDVDLLVTVGPEGDPAALGSLPDHVRVERFVAQSAVLPLVDVMVHHGGSGTVLAALECGVPQVLLPQGADQFLNADLLLAAGAARVVRADDPAGTIGAATSALLAADAPEVRRTAALRDEIAEQPAPAAVVDRLVALAGR